MISTNQLPGNQSPGKLAPMTHAYRLMQTHKERDKQSPTGKSADSDNVRHLGSNRKETDGANTSISHHRNNQDLLQVEQRDKMHQRQRPGFVSAEFTVGSPSKPEEEFRVCMAAREGKEPQMGQRLNEPSFATSSYKRSELSGKNELHSEHSHNF